ncbi:MAG: branched-chain amino acid ABC transporter permease [Chloroflexi bacterium]|nr:branched-chain amino acid ABC transporter permease [Chloroflexota bacterium]
MSYKLNWLRLLALYATPVLLIFYVIFYLIQPLDATWPSNLPGSATNVLLLLALIFVSPALLVASWLLPDLTGDPARLAEQRDRLASIRGYVILGGLIFISLLLPVIALFAFKAAPRYDAVISVIINGLLAGALYSLIALGYTLVYGIVELINFAHGEVFMIGSLTGFAVITAILGVKPGGIVSKDTSTFSVILVILFAILVAMLVCALLNFSIDRLAYKRLRNAPRLAPLITAIGISFILQNVGLYLNSSTPKGYPYLFPNSTRTGNADVVADWIGNSESLITFPVTSFIVIIAAAILLLGLRYLINSTRTGKAMRAVAQNREAAALMGVSIERTIGFAFLLGGALAGAAGVIYGIYNVSGTVRYDLGFQNGLFAFTAAVLGGIGNVNGAVLGGFFIGLIYSLSQSSFFSLTSDYLSLSVWAPVAVFGVLILIMIFRPTGLLGDSVQEKV